MGALKTGLTTLRARLKARTDSEHEQAIVRIVVVGIVLAYLAITYRPEELSSGHVEWFLVVGVAVYLVTALMLFVAICVRPEANVPRRYLGMLMDSGATTFCVALAGKSGIPLFGVYLFITFGNGFRYGRTYLFACQALSLLGFVGILYGATYWIDERALGIGLLCSLVVLPLYVSTLLTRVEEARNRAEEASRAKTSFLANMSHEMRTPLNGIAGATDLLQATSLNPQQNELVRLLRHSVVVLRSLVDDVLDISKIEAGRLSVEVVEFDLHGLLNGLVNLLRPHAHSKGLVLHAFVDPAIDYHIKGDPHHLRQVLLNLISNAVKFTESGEIDVSVTLVSETVEGWRLRFEVRDTGIGITPESQLKIFERFVQADDATTRRYGGTGLGTTIAKQLVELMGGSIGVKSKLGEGSTFWFDLPLLKTIAPSLIPAVATSAGPAVALLVTEEATAQRMQSLVAAAVGQVQTVNSVGSLLIQLQSLRERGVDVPAILVSGDVNTACEVFESVASQIGTTVPTAMIYLAAKPSDDAQNERLHAIEGVSCLAPDATPRLLRNAIHAATTRENAGTREGAEIIDLGKVLQQQRQPLRILVAEDNPTNQAIIRQLLERAGHTVILASDGEEALDMYEESQPELAILDFNMPERNGIEVCTAIRTMEPTGIRLPVIILSASVTVEARERVQRAGADEFVGKPFESAGLLQVIDRLARRAGRGSPSRARTSNPIAFPLVDRLRLGEVERIATDSAFLAQLLRGFRDDVESLLKRLDGAIANEQTSGVVDITHAIKGASLGVGAKQLAELCDGIDVAAAGAQIALLRTLATDMRHCFEATNLEFAAYTQQKQRASL